MGKKALSIILPLNNAVTKIDQLLDIFLDASEDAKEKFEVIIVDDGSTDETYKHLKKYYYKYKIFKITKQSIKGEGGAINTALDQVTGKYVKILNQDDSFDKDGFNEVLQFTEANHYDLIINGYTLVDDEQGEEREPSLKKIDYLGRGEIPGLGKKTSLSYKNMIYKTEVFKNNDFKAVENFFFSDIYTTIWFMRHAKTFYALEDITLYKYSITKESEKLSLENYVKYQQDFWKVLSIVLTEIDPLNEFTHDCIVNTIFSYALFDLALVWGKNKEPWKKHFMRIMNLVEKNIYLYEDYKKSVLCKKTMNGRRISFNKFATNLLKDLEIIRMI